MHKTIFYSCFGIAVWFFATASMAQVDPIVRVDVAPDEVAVGEPVALTVTVLGPTWFPKPPAYPPFELANAVTRLPPDSSYPTGVDVDGERWSGIVREYQVYPLIGASYLLSGQVMVITYADPDTRNPISVEVNVPDISFKATVPAGAEALDPYIAGSSLAVRREIDGEPIDLEAGGALVVRYIAELDGLPAIFLPPMIIATDVPGVSVYADQPVVDEGPPARRTEKLTFVFEAGGEFTLPGIELDWWNTKTRQIESARVSPIVVSVAGPPMVIPGERQAEQSMDWLILADWLAILFAAVWLLTRLMPRLRAWWRAVFERYCNSERYAFRQLRKSLHGNDPGHAYTSLVAWLGRIAPGMGIRSFALRFGDAGLREQLEHLSRSLYRNSGGTTHMKHLEQLLTVARRKAKRAGQDRSFHTLPPLNPQ